SGVGKGKKKTPAAKPRPTATGKPKKRPPAKRKRTSYDQIKAQLAVINQIKERLKGIVEKFDTAYPEGVDFTPTANYGYV
ncbi:unnamed protein product, partial [Laminaria digitata]